MFLQWQFQWGNSEQFLWRQYEKTGRLPPALERKPVLPSYLEPVWEAFESLSRSRNANGTIPLSEIYYWMKIAEINDYQERIDLIWFINMMDCELHKLTDANK